MFRSGEPARIIRANQQSGRNPSGAKAKQLCLDDASAASCHEISSEKVKHRAERRAQNETFASVPSLLQGHAPIDSLCGVYLAV
jgi:hypothetical protein